MSSDDDKTIFNPGADAFQADPNATILIPNPGRRLRPESPVPAGGDPLEFVFDVTGGDAAGLFGPGGGVILSDANFGGSFAVDWDNLIGGDPGTGAGVADTRTDLEVRRPDFLPAPPL